MDRTVEAKGNESFTLEQVDEYNAYFLNEFKDYYQKFGYGEDDRTNKNIALGVMKTV